MRKIIHNFLGGGATSAGLAFHCCAGTITRMAPFAHVCINNSVLSPIVGISPFDDISELDFESINLLTTFRAGSSPSFTIVDYRTYIERISGNASTNQNTVLPPTFLLSLSYRPHENTVLRLLSTSRISEEVRTSTNTGSQSDSDLDTDSKNAFASLMLSSGILYLQPLLNTFYPFQANLTTDRKNELTFIVSNGFMRSCVDGNIIENSPVLALWETGMDLKDHPVAVDFSPHLHAINQLVSVP